jgi:hypothetical protein
LGGSIPKRKYLPQSASWRLQWIGFGLRIEAC